MRFFFLIIAALGRPAFAAGDGIITTVAGASAVDNISATASLLNVPSGIVSDGVGNIYFTDANNHRIRRVDAGTQIITTIAGTGVAGYSGEFSPAAQARLNYPQDLVYTTVYGYPALVFTDTNNHRVRLINLQTGEIQTIAGNGVAGFAGDAGQAQYASLNGPHGVTVDPSGNLYIGDTYNHRVRYVEWSTRAITTVAGVGGASYSNLTYSARQSYFNTPVGVTYRGGYVYVCDQGNNIVRRITSGSLALSTVAGTTGHGYSGDGGPAIQATLRYPRKIIFDASSNAYVSDHYNHAIRRINSSFSNITTVAGSPPTAGYLGDGGPARSARLNTPQYIALAPDNDLLIGDGGNNCIRRVDSATFVISTIAGSGVQDNVPGTAAVLRSPRSPLAGAGQTLLFTEPDAYRVRSLNLGSGYLNTFAGTGAQGHSGDAGPASSATFFGPRALARDGAGNTYVADNYYYYVWYYNPFACFFFGIQCTDWIAGNSYLRQIDSFGNITTVAGLDPTGFNRTGDGGQCFSAGLGSIQALALSGNNLYLADAFFQEVRRIDLGTKMIYHFAGVSGNASYSGDNGPAATATLSGPQGLAVDSAGNLFISDTNNNAIRRVDAVSLSITTICGLGPSFGGYAGDGGPANLAALFRPSEIHFDAQDNLYIADSGNDRVRKIDKATGNISTVVGSGFRGFDGDGGPALQATLFNPGGIAVINGNDYYLADTGNNRVRKISFAATPAPTPVAQGVNKSVAYPSPASDRICFSYVATTAGKVEIQVYNSAMQPAGTIEDTLAAAGAGVTCSSVKEFATGLYLYRVIVNGTPMAPAKFKVIR